MKYKFLLPILILFIFGIVGCQKKIVPIDNLGLEPSETRIVEEVIIHEVPKNVSSPSEAVIHQYEVIFENEESEFPEKSSIISETTLGNNSIVAIRSPEGLNNYSVFLYDFEDEWFMDGHLLLGVLETKFSTNKEELALPIDKFNTISMKIRDDKEIWAFANKDVIMTIAVFDRYSLPDTPKAEKITLKNGAESFILKDQYQNSYLYYIDTDKVVVVSGNVSKVELVDLANSIPSVTAANFPRKQ